MIALLSPAKTLDMTRPLPPIQASRPEFGDEAEALASAAAKLSSPKLQSLMGISRKLADLNRDRFRGFVAQPERPALYAFAGDVYRGFDVASLAEEGIRFAQDHVRILSGLYGLLRPLDLIRPYRLEMGTGWAPGRAKDLYRHWGKRIGEALRRALDEEGSNTIVNLASREYFQAVETAPPAGARIVTIDFRESGPNGPRFVSFNAKRARGAMARWICEHHARAPEQLKGFDVDGYRFTSEGSDETTWRFLRG